MKPYLPDCQSHDVTEGDIILGLIAALIYGVIVITGGIVLCMFAAFKGCEKIITYQLPALPETQPCYDCSHVFLGFGKALLFIIGFGLVVCLFLKCFSMP